MTGTQRMALVSSAAVCLAGSAVAHATPPGLAVAAPIDDGADGLTGSDGTDAFAPMELSVSTGAAVGSDLTPGGLRLAGRYLHQLADRDWFDGGLILTVGSGDTGCMQGPDGMQCDHGRADGASMEFMMSVRRAFAPKQGFVPFARAGVSVRMARFAGDDLTGLAIPLLVGGGVRAQVGRNVSVGAEAQLEAGPGWFGQGTGTSLQLGVGLGAMAEFAL